VSAVLLSDVTYVLLNGPMQNFILENALYCDSQVIRILAYMKYEFDFVSVLYEVYLHKSK